MSAAGMTGNSRGRTTTELNRLRRAGDSLPDQSHREQPYEDQCEGRPPGPERSWRPNVRTWMGSGGVKLKNRSADTTAGVGIRSGGMMTAAASWLVEPSRTAPRASTRINRWWEIG